MDRSEIGAIGWQVQVAVVRGWPEAMRRHSSTHQHRDIARCHPIAVHRHRIHKSETTPSRLTLPLSPHPPQCPPIPPLPQGLSDPTRRPAPTAQPPLLPPLQPPTLKRPPARPFQPPSCPPRPLRRRPATGCLLPTCRSTSRAGITGPEGAVGGYQRTRALAVQV